MHALKFLIVSTGRNTKPWLEACLMSVAEQTVPDFQMVIVDDASTDGSGELLQDLCKDLGERFIGIVNDVRRGAMRNQVGAIRRLHPDPEDVIVWVDSDDRLAHPDVLRRLRHYYGDGRTRLTYGQYRSEPFSPTCNPAYGYPRDVIATSDYRAYANRGGGMRFNHLRTVKAELFNALEDADFQDAKGRWLTSCCDAAVMLPCMELADGRIRFVQEELYVYNSANPNSDWRRHPRQVDQDHFHILHGLKKKEPLR